ncbi:hypothetical protein [Methylobacterium nigriterrae]|uniref:hypothetical protein n=1 Tax=Methylobacterium nigriterrae TaxID=3127512 RepID=UPI003013DD58
MRFRLVGYGTGSNNGSGVAKQYRTLRGELDLSKTKYAAGDAGDQGLGLALRGTTSKSSEASADNEVAVELTNMTLTEIVTLSNLLCVLAATRRKMSKELVDGQDGKEFPLSFVDEITGQREEVIKALDLLARNVEHTRKLCEADYTIRVDERYRRIP